MRDGAPDYTAATFARRLQELAAYRQRLEAIDTAGWPVEARVDQALVRAEMNGFDFYARVLQPWARDPAFYMSVWTDQSDTPAHEGSEHHGIVELWTYQYPALPRGREKARRRTRRRPAAPRAGGNQPDRQCARPLGHRRGHDARADRLARCAREEDGRQRPRAEEGDQGRARVDRALRRLARCAGAVEERPVRDRARELHLEPPQRPPRPDDLGRGSGSAEARACARARLARSSRKRAIAACRNCR